MTNWLSSCPSRARHATPRLRPGSTAMTAQRSTFTLSHRYRQLAPGTAVAGTSDECPGHSLSHTVRLTAQAVSCCSGSGLSALLGGGSRLVCAAPGSGYRSFLQAFLGPLIDDVDPADRFQAGTRRDETSEDDVLLQADQVILLAADSCFGQHVSRVLRRSRRHPGPGREAGPGDAELTRLTRGQLLAVIEQLLVGVLDIEALDDLAFEEQAVPGFLDLHVLEHLPHDHLEVLVVHAHALGAVHLLDLVHDVLLHLGGTLGLQQVVRVDRAARQLITGLDPRPFAGSQPQVAVDPVRLGELAVLTGDGDPGAVVVLLDGDDAIELTDDCLDLRLTGLHQLDDTRQTLGHVST